MRSIFDYVPAPVARWPMNDNAASAVVIDAMGNHDGTFKDAGGDPNTDAHTVAGKIGRALDFDGTDDHVEITDHADFTPALTPFSISAKVYMHDATDFMIASKGVYNTDGEWRFWTTAADKLCSSFYDESVNSCAIGRIYDTALTSYENQWVDFLLTYDGGILSSGCKLYLNGARVDDIDNKANPGSFVAIENLNHAIWIGRYETTYANGLIDNVMFFDKELTARQARTLAGLRQGSIYGSFLRPNSIY